MFNEAYLKLSPLWDIVSDCYTGVEAIKNPERMQIYLPPQPAERAELLTKKEFIGSRYAFRSQVASYENFFKTTIDDIVGLMSKNRPKICFGVENDEESPQVVRDMKWKGTRFDDGLMGLKSRLNYAQALFGRYGLLLDVLTDEDGLNPEFCITEYPCWTILDGDYFESDFNSRKKLRWVLLDETVRKFNPESKSWLPVPRRRVLGVNRNGEYYNAIFEGTEVEGVWGQFNLDDPQESPEYTLIFPRYQGSTLNFIPFTVCNVNRLGIDGWTPPPYLDVAQIAVGNYVVDSWYKMGLYQFATPTLVVSNAKKSEDDVRLGGVLWLNSGVNSQHAATAQILETTGSALSELRNAKNELKESLQYTSIRSLIDGAGANSSGDALKLRTAAGTAAIAAMDKAGARVIEEQLRYAAIWAGATKDEAVERITFEADTTYLGQDFQLASVVSFIQANEQTKILSKQNAYSILERTFPDVISSYEDNEEQKLSDEESDMSAAANNPLFTALQNRLALGMANSNTDDKRENDNEDEDKSKSPPQEG